MIKVNIQILKKCREQAGFTQEDIKKKMKKITEIENDSKTPTPKQLSTLAVLYQVPRWVFIESKLPLEYQYEKMPAFRQFKKSKSFNLPKLRQLVTRVEQYRSLFLELRKDMDKPISQFSPVTPSDSARETADSVRKWLHLTAPLDFKQLRKKLEEKDIFIFMTSKYKGWSQIDEKSLRGFSIFCDTLPIIVINDLDYKKSQSFTLFHELGHLLKKHTAISCNNTRKREERWCDELAGCILMPSASRRSFSDLKQIKEEAEYYKISSYSCLVRLKQLHLVNQKQYEYFKKQLKKEQEESRRKFESSKNKFHPARKRLQEVKNQFGNVFIQTVIHTLNNRDITLHKASQILDIKRPSQVLKLKESL